MKKYRLAKVSELNLKLVLMGGQSFRWRQLDESTFISTIDKWIFKVFNDQSNVYYQYEPISTSTTSTATSTANENLIPPNSSTTSNSNNNDDYGENNVSADECIKSYFNLHVDVNGLYEKWRMDDDVFARLTAKGQWSSIRCLRIDPTECLFSFITSQNNNIPRITRLVNDLCKAFGQPVSPSPSLLPANVDGGAEREEYDDVLYTFPKTEDLVAMADEQQLREMGFGYRSKYIMKTAESLVQMAREHNNPTVHSFLINMRSNNNTYEQTKEILLKLTGVGPKVADCIALFSLDKLDDAIPVDTHVRAIAQKYYKYPMKTPKTITPTDYLNIQRIFTSRFGEYAGWAHTVLFIADLRYNNKQ